MSIAPGLSEAGATKGVFAAVKQGMHDEQVLPRLCVCSPLKQTRTRTRASQLPDAAWRRWRCGRRSSTRGT